MLKPEKGLAVGGRPPTTKGRIQCSSREKAQETHKLLRFCAFAAVPEGQMRIAQGFTRIFHKEATAAVV
jgi:hypothetical protein